MSETREELLTDILAETVKELMVYRTFVDYLRQRTDVDQQDVNSWLDSLRNDGVAMHQMRQDWQTHLAKRLSISPQSPHLILQEFVENWSPIIPTEIQ